MQYDFGWRNDLIKKCSRWAGKGDNTPFMLWARHSGRLPEKTPTVAMNWGKDNEFKACMIILLCVMLAMMKN